MDAIYKALLARERVNGRADALRNLSQSLNREFEALAPELAAAQAAVDALQDPVNPKVRDVSTVDNASLAERNAGQAAVVGLVKAHPETTEAEAVEAWVLAAKATRPAGRDFLLHDPHGLLSEYTANLRDAGVIQGTTWEDFRAWIIATPLEQMP